MSTPLLSVENIGRRFGGFVALEGVTAAFEPNKVTAIIGPNGAGKSTFFNVLSGALPPSSGVYPLQGQRPHRHAAAPFRASRHRALLSDHQHFPAVKRA